MYYINQIGSCELGRGETVEDAIRHANSQGFEILYSTLSSYHVKENLSYGNVYWTNEPVEGYND